jgi:hypothetical protein
LLAEEAVRSVDGAPGSRRTGSSAAETTAKGKHHECNRATA